MAERLFPQQEIRVQIPVGPFFFSIRVFSIPLTSPLHNITLAQHSNKHATLDYSYFRHVRVVRPVASLAVTHHRAVALVLDGVRLDLRLTPSPHAHAQVLERHARGVRVHDVVRHAQVHLAPRDVRLRTQLQQPRVQPRDGRRRARRHALGHGGLAEPVDDLTPRHHLGTAQLHRLAVERLGRHAVLADGGRHVAVPHGLLQRRAAVDVDQPRVDVELATDPMSDRNRADIYHCSMRSSSPNISAGRTMHVSGFTSRTTCSPFA